MVKSKSKNIKRPHKKLDPDYKAVATAARALRWSSSVRMLRANLQFVNEHFGYTLGPCKYCGFMEVHGLSCPNNNNK